MEVLDTTVVNVSLPHIAGNLSATIDESTWVLTSYLVANAIILPLTGWLASTFGRKRLLMASVDRLHARRRCCAASRRTCRCWCVFRLLQGATGGAMQPLSQAVLLEAFPPHERGKAMGFWGLGIVVAPILGPGARRLADRHLQLALGVLHQPAGRHRLAGDDQALRLRPAVPAAARRKRVDYWGIGLLALWASARCSWCSTTGSRTTGSRRRSSSTLVVLSRRRRWSRSSSAS